MQILRIRRVHWLAAVRASYFEKKQAANGGPGGASSDEQQIVCLIEELEKADQVESNNATTTTRSGSDSRHERTSSIALTIASDSALDQEQLLDDHERMNNFSNSTKISLYTPSLSSRMTPKISAKYYHRLFRSRNATPPPPASSSGSNSESPLAKNRSMTVSTP